MHVPSAQARLLDKLAAEGIDRSRVVFRGHGTMREYLAAHNEVDVILDTVPWTGHTTTMHALWMGVPTMSLQGTHHVGRFAEMIHHALHASVTSLSKFIATTPDRFVEQMASIADDRGTLATIRSVLRDKLLASPLCDHKALASRFEFACKEMYRNSRGWSYGVP